MARSRRHFPRLRSIPAGRLAKLSPKRAAEVIDRLKPNFIGHFPHPQVGIEQEVPGALDPDARDVIGELQGRAIPECLAEMKRADVNKLGDLSHAQFLGMVRLNEGFGFGDHR